MYPSNEFREEKRICGYAKRYKNISDFELNFSLIIIIGISIEMAMVWAA